MQQVLVTRSKKKKSKQTSSIEPKPMSLDAGLGSAGLGPPVATCHRKTQVMRFFGAKYTCRGSNIKTC